jgi:hypothetical protein
MDASTSIPKNEVARRFKSDIRIRLCVISISSIDQLGIARIKTITGIMNMDLKMVSPFHGGRWHRMTTASFLDLKLVCQLKLDLR